MTRGILGRLKTGQRQVNDVESIIAHLAVLLNTHNGDSGTAMDFGVPDFTDALHDMPNQTSSFLDTIRQVILRYEPRLRNVTVRLAPRENPLELNFEISARLNDANRTLLRFQSTVGPGGHFKVRS